MRLLVLKEQESNARYYQRCHNHLRYLTPKEKNQLEKLKEAWKKHDLKTVSQYASYLEATRREIQTWQRNLIEAKGRIKATKKAAQSNACRT